MFLTVSDTAKIWSLETNTLHREFVPFEEDFLTDCVWNNEYTQLGSCSVTADHANIISVSDGYVTTLNNINEAVICRFTEDMFSTGHMNGIVNLYQSNDILSTEDDDGNVFNDDDNNDRNEIKIAKQYVGNNGQVTALDFNGTYTNVLIGTKNGDLVTHNFVTGNRFPLCVEGYVCHQPSKDSDSVHSNSTSTSQRTSSNRKYYGGISCAFFSHHRPYLVASAHLSGAITLWDCNAQKCIQDFRKTQTLEDAQLAFSPINPYLLVSVSLDGRLGLFDVKKEKQLKMYQTGRKLCSIDIYTSGYTIAAGTADGNALIYDLRYLHMSDLKPVNTIVCCERPLRSLKFRHNVISSRVSVSSLSNEPQQVNRFNEINENDKSINNSNNNNNSLLSKVRSSKSESSNLSAILQKPLSNELNGESTERSDRSVNSLSNKPFHPRQLTDDRVSDYYSQSTMNQQQQQQQQVQLKPIQEKNLNRNYNEIERDQYRSKFIDRLTTTKSDYENRFSNGSDFSNLTHQRDNFDQSNFSTFHNSTSNNNNNNKNMIINNLKTSSRNTFNIDNSNGNSNERRNVVIPLDGGNSSQPQKQDESTLMKQSNAPFYSLTHLANNPDLKENKWQKSYDNVNRRVHRNTRTLSNDDGADDLTQMVDEKNNDGELTLSTLSKQMEDIRDEFQKTKTVLLGMSVDLSFEISSLQWDQQKLTNEIKTQMEKLIPISQMNAELIEEVTRLREENAELRTLY
ncbi:hypothetical protein SNEBB_001398 [Seison nebaliae]|nr:hypothetical protein SNEBB_001398 [Seison nebaliae]